MDPKTVLQSLILHIVSMALDAGLPLSRLRGIACYDSSKDAKIIELDSFDASKKTIVDLPHFVKRYGAAETTRIVLQFVYEYFRSVDDIRYDEPVYDALWTAFLKELANPKWVVRGVANLKNFQTEKYPLDLGDGITILGRSRTDLLTLGFNDTIIDRIDDDWSGFGASSFVLVAEQDFLKLPENLINIQSGLILTKARRSLWALRLTEAGSVNIGPMWVTRPARFNVGLGGISSFGYPIPAMGTQYAWTENSVRDYQSIYRDLGMLEKDGYARSPGNLDIALRFFMATYDHWPSFQDSQLLDLITCLEALLGSDSEISFKLAFCISSLLAATDNERSEVFDLIKGFYDARSKIVHGVKLKAKQQHYLAKLDELGTVARRLLRAFIHSASNTENGFEKKCFQLGLEARLLNGAKREKLRTMLGL